MEMSPTEVTLPAPSPPGTELPGHSSFSPCLWLFSSFTGLPRTHGIGFIKGDISLATNCFPSRLPACPDICRWQNALPEDLWCLQCLCIPRSARTVFWIHARHPASDWLVEFGAQDHVAMTKQKGGRKETKEKTGTFLGNDRLSAQRMSNLPAIVLGDPKPLIRTPAGNRGAVRPGPALEEVSIRHSGILSY